MKPRTQTAGTTSFDRLPKDYPGLCQSYVPRPLHDAADYASACQAIEPLVGFSDRLTADQADYIEAVSTFIEAYDEARVQWPKGTPLDTLNFLLEQHDMTAADLSRLLGADRSLGPKILRSERRLTVDHIRTLARHCNVDPGLLL
jgi:HTH-type transcriptional regulator/antitoxin HigA